MNRCKRTFYVGQTKDLATREKQHKYSLNKPFTVAVLEECVDKAEAITAEEKWIRHFALAGCRLLNIHGIGFSAPKQLTEEYFKHRDERRETTRIARARRSQAKPFILRKSGCRSLWIEHMHPSAVEECCKIRKMIVVSACESDELAEQRMAELLADPSGKWSKKRPRKYDSILLPDKILARIKEAGYRLVPIPKKKPTKKPKAKKGTK